MQVVELTKANEQANAQTRVKTKPVSAKGHARKPRAKSKTVKAVKKVFSPARVSVTATLLFTMAVSITHLANGVMLMAETPLWEGWAMAVGIDFMLMSVGYALMTAAVDVRKEIHHAALALEILALAWSGYLNAVGFSHGHLDYDHAVQIALGCTVPLFILGQSYILTRLK